MDKKIKVAKQRQEDAALNRALLWIAGAVILEGLLMLIDRFYINFYTDELSIAIALGIGWAVRVCTILFLVVAAAAVAWRVQKKRSGKPTLLLSAVAVAALALAVFCGVIWVFNANGVTLLYVLVPAAAVLALVYYLYQRECFLAVGLTALGIFGMWLVRKGSAGPYAGLIQAYLAVMALVSLVLLAGLVWLHGKGGVLTRGEQQVRLLRKKANYPLLYLTCVLLAAAFVAALVMGPALTYYLIFALIAWAFILIVYYTVQLL